jgi:acetate kinase
MRLLVVNAGSSSLKLVRLDDDGGVTAATTVEAWQGDGHLEPLAAFLAGCGPVDAVGHRVVHGGPRHTGPVRVDDAVIGYLDSISHLAPLHNPRALGGVRSVRDLLPGVPAVACFDTTFHATLPAAARTYAVPREWNERWQLRRYGFHGLSHAYAVRRGAELVGRPAEELRIVSCHLGAGASLAAVRGGVSVDTTMGFTPLEGLVMATRSGSVDPGLVLWLVRQGIPAEEVHDALERASGLLALAGTGDMREILERGDDEAARLALAVYLHRLVAGVAAMAAAAGGLDALVFTGGVGEHAHAVRSAAGERLAFLGVALDDRANAGARGDTDVTAAGATVRCAVVAAREDLEMARQARALIGT